MGKRRYIAPAAKRLILRMSNLPRLTQRKVAELAGVHPWTVYHIRKTFAETGDVVRVPLVQGRPRSLTTIEVAFLEACVERQPDIMMRELRDQLRDICHIDVSSSTIGRSLRRRGFTRKLVSREAIERDEIDRGEYRMLIARYYLPEQLVFVDESAFDRRTAQRRYVWAPCGTRGRRRDCFIRGKRYTILPALSLDGIIYVDVLERPFTASAFRLYIEGLLDEMNPWPQRNSVIVMDNASIHKSDELRELIEQRGMRLVYLPTYSPDLNPIEEAFSSIKYWIRANRDYVLGELGLGDDDEEDPDPYHMLWRAIYTVTPEKAEGWFHNCGYV